MRFVRRAPTHANELEFLELFSLSLSSPHIQLRWLGYILFYYVQLNSYSYLFLYPYLRHRLLRLSSQKSNLSEKFKGLSVSSGGCYFDLVRWGNRAGAICFDRVVLNLVDFERASCEGFKPNRLVSWRRWQSVVGLGLFSTKTRRLIKWLVRRQRTGRRPSRPRRNRNLGKGGIVGYSVSWGGLIKLAGLGFRPKLGKVRKVKVSSGS